MKMDIKAVLNGKHDCLCQKDHLCDIRYVELGSGVLEKLAEICSDFSHILLVADENTYPLCGARVEDLLKSKIYDRVLFGKEIVVPNEDSIALIEQKTDAETDLIIGIGSGVINDLCKHVSFLHGIRYATIFFIFYVRLPAVN